jgi:activating signal cointegrator 1
VKAITLTEPWAILVALNAKRVETRSWTSGYRGPLAIHAAKRFPRDCQELCASEPFLSVLKAAGFTHTRELPTGAIVCVSMLDKIWPTFGFWERNSVRAVARPHERAFGNYDPDRYGWLLGLPARLATPVPVKGALGLWTVPPEIERAVLDTSVTSNQYES